MTEKTVTPSPLPEKAAGFVIDARTGAPIAHAPVRLEAVLSDGTQTTVANLRADGRGYVSFKVPPLGAGRVEHLWIRGPHPA